jgi:hypothetical protein
MPPGVIIAESHIRRCGCHNSHIPAGTSQVVTERQHFDLRPQGPRCIRRPIGGAVIDDDQARSFLQLQKVLQGDLDLVPAVAGDHYYGDSLVRHLLSISS